MKKTGFLLVLTGALLILFPFFTAFLHERQQSLDISRFRQEYESNQEYEGDQEYESDQEYEGNQEDEKSQKGAAEEAASGDSAPLPEDSDTEQTASDALKEEAQHYNRILYETGQSEFTDASSVEAFPEQFPEIFGYLEIPAMELTIPLYLGASEEHLAKGAAVLGQTSLPIGGTDTNAVIAAHRGYQGTPFFREIEKLQEGDEIRLVNCWDTLTYRVEQISVIDPTDSDAVRIREGEDMITLITCHPYRSHGKYRYVVYCVRETTETRPKSEEGSSLPSVEQETEDLEETEGDLLPEKEDPKQTVLSSEADLEQEDLLRGIAVVLVVLILFLTLFRIGGQIKNEQRISKTEDKGRTGEKD